MVHVHAFEYIRNPFEEVKLTLDVKEKTNADVEQKNREYCEGQQQYNILVNKNFVEKSSSMIPSNKNKRY